VNRRVCLILQEDLEQKVKNLEAELRGAQELLAEVMAASDRASVASPEGAGPGDRQGLERLMQEVEALRVRMAEASAEAAGEASSPAKVLEALDASDARLQVGLHPSHELRLAIRSVF
jgi:DNA repair exonuclease SbcCD ATPase subunit